jgi:hypothetical protein
VTKLNILKAIRDGKTLDLRKTWVEVIELSRAGLVRLTRQPNGQLLIDGLTPAGENLLKGVFRPVGMGGGNLP